MGKRKSSKPPPKKQRPKLSKAFNCPFCNSDKTVIATLDWEEHKGKVECTVCHETYGSQINALTEAVDIYSDWIDACEEANS